MNSAIHDIDMSITGLKAAYSAGEVTPQQLHESILQHAEKFTEHNIWIKLLSGEEVQPYLDKLQQLDPKQAPLWGIPFTLKDNIDLAGIETTAGCTEFTYKPHESATVVQRLLEAGAIPIGKANLDQFATGLNGTRSPWGACRNSFNPDFISGGSSAGSAVSVALGLSTFSLGTDTAGSGRVPAGFNNLVGLKPSRGLLSAAGVVPACKSLDCVSIFAYNTDDANLVLAVAEGVDENDDYSRPNVFDNSTESYGYRTGDLTVGILKEDDLRFFGDADYAAAYRKTLATLAASGFQLEPIDYAPFDEVARLLYEGPWVAERYIATCPLIEENPAALNDTVRRIIEPGGAPPATALFKAQYRLQALKRQCLQEMSGIDCLLTPTAGKHFSIAQLLDNPIEHNSELGYYTNFVNLLDLAAVSVPAVFTSTGMPFGITVVGNTHSDRELLSIANRIQQTLPLPAGALSIDQPSLCNKPVSSPRYVDIVVCGAHMTGLPLNSQLTTRGSIFREKTQTTAGYSLYKLPGDSPMRPALVRDIENGRPIEVEIWSMPVSMLGGFVNAIPSPLGIGKVELEDGRNLSGFICAEGSLTDAENITDFGGWRAFGQNRYPGHPEFGLNVG